jgi:hypothetical protein
MEVPASLLSSKRYETYISIDLTEPDGPPIVTALGEGTVANCVGMISALSSGINLSDHAARSMI